MTVAERFWTKVEFTDTCWLWTASSTTKGYGRFWDDTRVVRAHRWAYEFCVGPIPEGLSLDHLCRVRLCVRPYHLEPVTGRVNILRGVGLAALNARKTHCIRGHEYTEINTAVQKGRRYCRKCKLVSTRRTSARRYQNSKWKHLLIESSAAKVG